MLERANNNKKRRNKQTKTKQKQNKNNNNNKKRYKLTIEQPFSQGFVLPHQHCTFFSNN